MSRLTDVGRLSDADVYYGWVIVAACFLASSVVFGTTYSFGVFFDRFVSDFSASHARLSLVFGVQTFVMYVGSVGVGGLIDRYGVKRSLYAGTALLAGGLLWTSQSHSFLSLVVAYGVVAALGLSTLYIVAYATVPRWFERRRGFANGIASSGLGVGLLVVAPLSSALIGRFGWRDAYVALTVVLVAALGVVALLVVDSPETIRADTSEEFPDGRPEETSEDWHEVVRTIREVGLSSSFLTVFLGWVLVYGTLYVLLTYLPTYTAHAGFGKWVGVTAISIIGVVTSVSRVVLGYASDSLGRLRIFVVCSATMALSVLALSAADSALAVFGVVTIFGIAYGGNGALLSPLTADLFGSENINTVFGMISVAFAVAGLLAPYLAGVGFDAMGRFGPVFIATGATGLVGATLIGVAGSRRA